MNLAEVLFDHSSMLSNIVSIIRKSTPNSKQFEHETWQKKMSATLKSNLCRKHGELSKQLGS